VLVLVIVYCDLYEKFTSTTKNSMSMAKPSISAAGLASFSLRFQRKPPPRISLIAHQQASRSTSPKETANFRRRTGRVFLKLAADQLWNALRRSMYWWRANWQSRNRLQLPRKVPFGLWRCWLDYSASSHLMATFCGTAKQHMVLSPSTMTIRSTSTN